MKALASAARYAAPLFSAESAALLWGLPVASIPELVQINIPRNSGQRSRGLACRRQFPVLEDGSWMIDGLTVTGKVQTAVELALRSPLPWALVAFDRLLSLKPLPAESSLAVVSGEQVMDAIGKLPVRTKMRRATTALDLANGLSGSPGESISRANMGLRGLTMPRTGSGRGSHRGENSRRPAPGARVDGHPMDVADGELTSATRGIIAEGRSSLRIDSLGGLTETALGG